MSTINLFKTIYAAESSTRYSRDNISKEESILLHVGFVATWTFFAAKLLEKNNIEVDIGLALQKAIVHDIDEVGTGDIPRITKYANKDILGSFRKVEESSVKSLENEIKIDILELWKSAKNDSVEGTLIKLADIASVVYRIWIEIIHKNNYSFYRVSKEVEENLRDMFDAMYKKDPKLGHEMIGEPINCFLSEIFHDFLFIVVKANDICKKRESLALIDIKIGA